VKPRTRSRTRVGPAALPRCGPLSPVAQAAANAPNPALNASDGATKSLPLDAGCAPLPHPACVDHPGHRHRTLSPAEQVAGVHILERRTGTDRRKAVDADGLNARAAKADPHHACPLRALPPHALPPHALPTSA
jgi:hypothetical protein